MERRTGAHLLLAIVLAIGVGAARAAEPVLVVMDPASGLDRLTREQVINIFLGRFRRLPNAQAAVPIDRSRDEALMTDFYRLLVDKSPAEIRAYWARLVFSGKTEPPQKAHDLDDMIERLANTPGAVAYIRPDELSERLRVVLGLGLGLGPEPGR
ncbi:hypothetical protein F2Q65_07515 [Thiohalocapsa marina]|uniref:Phosphate ABC transporter substrate-binding protein n=1 Tax=Thiohalocapsa marina TaxID=424902 RepID=A0A5M8FLW4_9GAMM|nr:hypothetical protein [Thiohalocapsa marina]KAA6185838.1 hypothetical protein F2Q65_07515 [Thiohalocapsa marina]